MSKKHSRLNRNNSYDKNDIVDKDDGADAIDVVDTPVCESLNPIATATSL